MPMELDDNNVIILSKFPYSQCVFCGGGSETQVASINTVSMLTTRISTQAIIHGNLKPVTS